MTIPSLKGRRTGTLDLDGIARVDAMQRGIRRSEPNPYALPEGAQDLINRYHGMRNLDASYGSYGEKRGFVWRGTYLDAMEDPTHIGLDVNVPAGTAIDADFDATVVWVGTDYPDEYGWGNRVILKCNARRSGIQIWMIYAHLATPQCTVGDTIKKGSVFARVGAPDENGGWFPHLHVQTLTHDSWQMFKKDPYALDGYCPGREWKQWQRLCPNPLQFLNVP